MFVYTLLIGIGINWNVSPFTFHVFYIYYNNARKMVWLQSCKEFLRNSSSDESNIAFLTSLPGVRYRLILSNICVNMFTSASEQVSGFVDECVDLFSLSVGSCLFARPLSS